MSALGGVAIVVGVSLGGIYGLAKLIRWMTSIERRQMRARNLRERVAEKEAVRRERAEVERIRELARSGPMR